MVFRIVAPLDPPGDHDLNNQEFALYQKALM
jgi:hypothetical protein